MRRFRENFYNDEAPEEFHWRWEEMLALVVVLLWIVAAFVGTALYIS